MNVHLIIEYVIDGISLGSLYALFALGIGLLFGIMRLINFAHGELMMIGAYGLFFIVSPPWPIRSAADPLDTPILAALLMQRVAFRRLAEPIRIRCSSPRSPSASCSKTSLILIFGALPLRCRHLARPSPGPFRSSYSIPNIDLVTVGVTVGLLFAFGIFLAQTRLGVQMRAAAENFRMARLLGVRANTVIATAFALSGLLAGVASIILVQQTGIIQPTIGVTPVLAAFVATILGDWAMTGAVVVDTFLVDHRRAAGTLPLAFRSYRDAFVFGAVLLVLVLRPQGLLVHRSTYHGCEHACGGRRDQTRQRIEWSRRLRR